MYFKKNPTLKFFLLCLYILVSSMYVNAQHTLLLSDSATYYPLRNNLFEIFEDTNNSCPTVESIQLKNFQSKESFFITNTNPSSTYWAKFSVTENSSINNNWFFISYNYSIDSLDIFAYKKSTILFHKQYRFHSPELTTQEMRYKHFTVDFPIQKNDTLTVYIKLKNKFATQYELALVEHKTLFTKSVFEFYLYGLFYGSLLMMAFYHLILYFNLRDKVYVFYTFYILLQALYLSFRDSTALANIFYESPWIVEYSMNTLFFLLSTSSLIYGRSFLELKTFKWFNILLISFIIIRIPGILLFKNYPLVLMWLDLCAPVLVFIFAIISRLEQNKTASLVSISFFVVSIGYLINVMWHENIIDCTEDVFYSLYYTIIIQSLLLAIANTYRLNKLKADALNKKRLEEKVLDNLLMIKNQEAIIQEKTNDLNMLLYRASHDIKGPLKSIDGLSYLGIHDKEDKDVYFEKINIVSKRLQNILNALLHIAEYNRSKINRESIVVYDLIQECIEENLAAYPDIKKISFNIHVAKETNIQSERFTLLSVIQNIIENAIKYMDKSKSTNHMAISYTQTENQHILLLEDNGIGINEKHLKSIFQMFYRANNVNPGGVGLGLYIVKQHIDRLGGQIEIESKESEFTRFTIRLPK